MRYNICEPMVEKSSKWKWFLVFNLLAVFFLIFAFGREYVGNLQIENQISRLQDDKSNLEKNKLSTLDLMQELSSEYYLEKEARTKQGLGRPGETLIVIEDSVAGADPGIGPMVEITNPQRWFYYFFNPNEFDRLAEL